MKILLVHNHYQLAGGEDETVADEEKLLVANGHSVAKYLLHNHAIRELGRVELGLKTLWNRAAYADLRRVIRCERPDVVHAHNLFPLISPAAYYAAAAERVPLVQSLHNYRLLCVGGMLSRDGRPCEVCASRLVPWPGVLHACYRDRAHSLAIAAMLSLHRGLDTWRRHVGIFIALTEFARAKFIENGLPAERTLVKPNFVPEDPGPGSGSGNYALYVGRLSAEKGVATLLAAWSGLGGAPELRVVGDGPLRPSAERRLPGIRFLGHRARREVYGMMRDAKFVVVPSEVYETFGRVAVEAFAAGTPVLASRIGALAEVVADGRTGLSFAAGDIEDLRRKVMLMCQRPESLARMRRAARAEYERKYTPERNYRMLLQIYQRSMRGMPARPVVPLPSDGVRSPS